MGSAGKEATSGKQGDWIPAYAGMTAKEEDGSADKIGFPPSRE
jgi:hypothetical protein